MAFQKIDGVHTAEAIGITVAKILKPILGTLLLFLLFNLHHHYSKRLWRLLCLIFLKYLLEGNDSSAFAGVVDGGDIASVKFTAASLNMDIKDNTCICHKLNNVIKRMLQDYFEENYLVDWRTFVKRTNKSHPFREAWDRCCLLTYNEKVILQIDTPTR